MSDKSKQPTLRRISWLMWGILAVVIVLLISAFGQALTLNATLREKVATLEPLLAEQRRLNTTLEAQLEYAQSDAYVEAWAQDTPAWFAARRLSCAPRCTPTPTPPLCPSLTPRRHTDARTLLGSMVAGALR